MARLPWLLWLLALVAGCGRLGYEDWLGDGSFAPGDPSDGAGDGALRDGADGDGAGSPGDGAAMDGTPGGAVDAGLDAGEAPHAGDAGSPPLDASVGATGFARLCEMQRIVVVQDGSAADSAAGIALSATFRAGCLGGATSETVDQDDPGVLDPDSDRPLLGPDAVAVVAGGPAVQRAAAYLDAHGAPVVNDRATDFSYRLREAASGRVLVDADPADLGASHDFIVLMINVEPISGTTIFSAYGYDGYGTAAGARWFADNLFVNVRDATTRWYVIEWTDDDGSTGPSADDTYTVVASG